MEEYATLRDLRSLEQSTDLKLENVRVSILHDRTHLESATMAVDDHETRLKALEGKEIAAKAGRYDKAVKWAIGILSTSLTAWALMNIGNILNFLATIQPKGGTP